MHDGVNVLNTTDLYTPKWLRGKISCYVHFTTIKKFKWWELHVTQGG